MKQQIAIRPRTLRQWQETLWLLIALLTPLFVNFWVEQQFEASKVWLVRTLVWILAALWVAGRLGGERVRLLPASVRNLGLALCLVVALATWRSDYPFVALFGSLERANGALTLFSYLLLFGCVATQIDAVQRRRLLHVLVATAVPISLLGLAQAAGWQPLPVLTDARSPLVTTLGRANFSGAYLALLLPLTLTAAQLATQRWLRIGYGTLAGLEALVIGLTQARAAWIAAAVGLGLLFWFNAAPRWSQRLRRVSGLGGPALLGAGLLLVLPRALAGGGSFAARWAVWQASLRLLWPRLWLGYGTDTLELIFPSVYPPQLVYYQGRGVVVDRAHNWLLDWSLSYGVVATILFAGLVGLILWHGWRRLANADTGAPVWAGEGGHEARWLAACMAVIGAQLVGNLFLFEVAATAVVFWLLLAIVTAATVADSSLAAPLLTPTWLRRALVPAAVLAVGGAVWLGNVRPLLADLHSWRATGALSRGNFAAALVDYDMASQFQPQRAAYRVAAALTAAQTGDFARAEQALAAAIALRPADPVLYTQLAAVYAGADRAPAEKLALAYAAYEQAITLAPTIGLTYQQAADLALRSGDVERARAAAERAVDLDATDGMSFGILGWATLQRGDLEAAQRAFAQAVRWQPASADFHLGLATVYFAQGLLAEARLTLARSLVLDPGNEAALLLQQQLR